MTPIISLFVANLPALISAGKAIGNFVRDFRSAAKQSGEWTEEAEAAFQRRLDAANYAPESRTDKEVEGDKK